MRRLQVGLVLVVLVLAASCGGQQATDLLQPTPTPQVKDAPTSPPTVTASALQATPTLVPVSTPIPTLLPPQPDDAQGFSAPELATLASLQQVDSYPLYVMHYQAGYDLGASVLEGVGRFVDADRIGPVPSWACSLFAALGDEETRLYGRNFDWRFSPALLLYTDPPDGYASVSMVDIEYLGFGRDSLPRLTELSLEELRGLLGAPHIPFDGMNDQGLSVGMAAVPSGGMRPDPDKETVDSLGVIREMLDHASNVDEAVAILQSYNIDMGVGPPLHYLIADRSGRSILAEFYQGEMVPTPGEEPWQQATNFLLASISGFVEGQCWRYDAIGRALSAAAGEISNQEAMDLLASVAVDGTQWSVVYGLSTGEIDVVMGRQYDNPHAFQLGLEGESMQAGEPEPGGATVGAPVGMAPTLDGTLSPAEWRDASEAELAGGGKLLLMQDGEYLYLGIRAPSNGLGSLCLDQGDEVAILHASAALGTAVYEKQGDAWQRSRSFSWTCRDPGDTQKARAAREKHLQQEGWLASLAVMGDPSEMEYQIAMPEGSLRLAVTYLQGRSVGSAVRWPAELDDDCLKLQLMQGNLPDSAQFLPGTWMRVEATAAAVPETAALPSAGDQMLAFTSGRSGNMDIYLMDATGGNQQRLTEHPRDDYWPTWSPDGARIAFASERSGNFDIYLMGVQAALEGAGEAALQQMTEGRASDLEPAWSPDGARIAFMSDRDGNWEIYTVDLEGGDVQRLTNHEADDWLPAWSPDGQQIAFVSDRDGNFEIYVMEADGDDVRRLTEDSATDSYPAWSPDGKQISFVSNRSGHAELYLMSLPDGSTGGADGLRQLTHDGATVWVSAWSPDGRHIAFTSDRDGNREIYRMAVPAVPEGAAASPPDLLRLTDNRFLDGTPAWRTVLVTPP